MDVLATTWASLVLVLVANGWTFAAGSQSAAEPMTQPAVKIIQAPANSFVPDVAIDAGGRLHMVYALERNAYYVRSMDNGATFTAPVKVNLEGSVEFKMGERGPKLSVGSDGVIHVVWVDCWAPGVKTLVRYSRSLDGGKTFAPLKALSSSPGVDGVTMAADGAGHVAAFWHVAQPPQKEIPQATTLHMARSEDNGASFGPDEIVKVDTPSNLACSMCMMRARFGGDGQAYLAFRSAEGNIRDFYVLQSAAGKNSFGALRINQDNWRLESCPMCGPELTFVPGGRLLCAFMSKHRVYWAVSDMPATRFDLHVATPTPKEDEIYPCAVANRAGDVLLVWQVGPMSTSGKATVKWARYRLDGTFTGQKGIVGQSTSGTKATAFVGTDDHFYIVTTAK